MSAELHVVFADCGDGPNSRNVGEAEVFGAAVVVGCGGIEVRLGGLEVPGGPVESGCRDELTEARREHEYRDHPEDAEHCAEVRGADRHRGSPTSGFEGHTQATRRGRR